MHVVRKAAEAPCRAPSCGSLVNCLLQTPWRPRCKSMAKRIWHSCQVHPSNKPSCRSIIPHKDDSKVAVSPIIPPDDSIINGSNPICCCSYCCFVSRCLRFKSAYRVLLTKGEEPATCWVWCWKGLVMSQSNASRGNLLQEEMWISGRPLIKISAGRCWGANPLAPIWVGYVHVGQGDTQHCERKYTWVICVRGPYKSWYNGLGGLNFGGRKNMPNLFQR